MKLRILHLLAIGALLCPVNALASLVLIDFGSSAQTTSPNYNNITQASQDLANAIDFNTGSATGISLNQTGASSGFALASNQDGTTTGAAGFVSDATRDSLFGHNDTWDPGGNVNRIFVEYRIAGLMAGTQYNFEFFASRLGVTDDRSTAYTLNGQNSGSATLNAAGNSTNSVSINQIVADSNGEIILQIQKGVTNDNSFGFFYLGGLRLQAVPEPSSALLFAFGIAGILGRRRSS